MLSWSVLRVASIRQVRYSCGSRKFSHHQLSLSAVAGTAGVVPTHAAVQAGRTIALANKIALVTGAAGVPK